MYQSIGVREVIGLLKVMGYDVDYCETQKGCKRIYITNVNGKKYTKDARYQPEARQHLLNFIGGIINGEEENKQSSK